MTTYGGFDLTNPYGPRGYATDGFHDGIDVGCPVGTPLYAPFDAVVTWRTDSIYGWSMNLVERGGNRKIRLAHLSQRTARDGVTVSAGAKVAETGGARGATGAGNSQGPHLHTELRVDDHLIDPQSQPLLIEALFNGGIEMTKDEIRDLLEYELGQRDLLLAERLDGQAGAAPDGSTTQAVLKRLAAAHRSTGEANLEAGKD